jgi:hypothetical protein
MFTLNVGRCRVDEPRREHCRKFVRLKARKCANYGFLEVPLLDYHTICEQESYQYRFDCGH